MIELESLFPLHIHQYITNLMQNAARQRDHRRHWDALQAVHPEHYALHDLFLH